MTELEWFTNYLFQRSQRVQINEKVSDSCPVYCGVPQGSILGPTLFLIFFNDFSEILMHCDVIQFADDTVILVSAKDVQSIESMLNIDLKNMSKFFTENELIINLEAVKTECMLLGTSRKLSTVCNQLQLFYNFTPIHVTKSYKYLGTIVNPNLNLGEQFDKTYKKM